MGNGLLKICVIAFVLMLITTLITWPSAFASHTTKGARFWYNVCKSIDFLIVEPCGTLVSNHDPKGQGLSTDGFRVAVCVAGGALAIAGQHPEYLAYGPALGCAAGPGNLFGLLK